MRGTWFLAVVGCVDTLTQAAFEPLDFDITQALLANGVDVSSIPALSQYSLDSGASACEPACSSLHHLFGGKVSTPNTSTYEAFTQSYWSGQQASVDPHCIFSPAVARDVSILVLIARLTRCPFAIKSGGHAAFAGASSIQGGITVSFKDMKSIELSEDKSTASIEPGNTWYDVYHTLEPEDLAVIGGRVSAIGVGGLTLGGGISFFSNEYGWACDNVASFEVVTATGALVTASPSSHADLYWSLRGGGNNFGIVTKFVLETISQGLIWGGARLHVEEQFEAVMDAFYNLGTNSPQDVAAAQILSFAYVQNTRIASSELEYSKPIANASIFSEYLAIPAIEDGTMIRTLANATLQINTVNPNGLRETYWSVTFKLDRDFTAFTKDVFFEEVLAIADAAAVVPALTLQVVTLPMLRNFAKNGGNALGLSADDGPLLLLSTATMWADEADDERVLEASRKTIERTVEEGKKRGLSIEYIYMNYASQFQDVVASYGSESLARLKAVAQMYDPTGVFQVLQPGYFKLDGLQPRGVY
ncbi:hypothetical protein DPSP01_007647 [Paraphaeosphaeria sporulosa]|uniref:FAD binding domain-containing protein n=1 Tax=Paraphaeosphaeria sporulosa TaxID=1460663 RepID=A0A177CDS0_9PLEO|nr:FAD binding domain-containing protein [Paraphaeosphaeria sporulosa]OAG04860.1 FAD binding domain-containing protein [Paraphaeosphaeria sporulosa]